MSESFFQNVEVTKVANNDIGRYKKSGNRASINSIAKILIDLSENHIKVWKS